MAEISRTFERAIGIPEPLTEDHIWTAQAGFTQQTPQPGIPDPQIAQTLQLTTSGSQSADGALRVRVQRAGHPGPGGCAFTWKAAADADTEWRGRDNGQLSHWQSVSWVSSAAQRIDDPDVAVLSTGQILVVYQKLLAGSYRVRVATQSLTDGSWSTADAYTGGSTVADGFHPAICVLEDGAVLIAHWVYDAVNDEAQIQTLRSDDDGSTWTVISRGALDTPIQVGSGATEFEVARLRMASNGKQVLLIAQTISNTTTAQRDGFVQLVSSDFGGRFSTVETDTDTTERWNFHDIAVLDGQFVIAVITAQSALKIFRLGSATDKISAARSAGFSTIGSGQDLIQITTNTASDGEGTLWTDDDGALYWSGINFTVGSVTFPFTIVSLDGGTSWNGLNGGTIDTTTIKQAKWLDSSDDDVRPNTFVGCSSLGRQVLLHKWQSDTATEGSYSLAAAYLGGHSTVELPAMNTYPALYQRMRWEDTWVPFDIPSNISTGNWTATGSGTAALSSGALNLSTTASQRIFYSRTNSDAIARGMVVRFRLDRVSGGSLTNQTIGFSMRLADGTDDYQIDFRFSTSGFDVYDENGSSKIGSTQTITWGDSVEVLAAMNGANFACWHRTGTAAPDRKWTAGPSTVSLTNESGSPEADNLIQFGQITLSTVVTESNWYEVHYTTGVDTATSLETGQTNPDDLFGRSFPAAGRSVPVTDGVRLSVLDGAGREGTEFHIDVRYDYPISRIFHSQSPSLSDRWRSTAVTPATTAVAAQFIPFVLNKTASSYGAAERGLGVPVVYLHCAGINWRSATLERYDVGTTAFTSVSSIDTGISFTGTRRDNEVYSSGSTSTGHFLHANEAAGWFVDLGNNVIREVATNTAGVLAGTGYSGQIARFFLKNTDGSEPQLGSFVLFPDRFTLAVPIMAETAGAWALRISSQRTAHGWIEMGHMSFGAVWVPGRRYSRGRVLAMEAGDLVADDLAGTRRTRAAGRPALRVRIAWVDPIDQSQLATSTAAPDYRTVTDGSTTEPWATVDDVPFSLLGIFQELQRGTAILYFPSLLRSQGSGTLLTRRHDHMLGTLDMEAVQIEHVTGDALRGIEGNSPVGEAFRVATTVIREVR